MVKRLHTLETQDDFTRWAVASGGFLYCRRLGDGTYIGICPLATTYGFCIGVTETEMYKRRYCYVDLVDALFEYTHFSFGHDIPSGGWVARRPETLAISDAKSRPHYDPSQFWGKV